MKMKKLSKHLHFGTAYILLIAIGFGWHLGSEYFYEQTNYEAYAQSLKEASLDNSLLVKSWITEGEKAFENSKSIQIPYSDSIYFSQEKPESKAYTFNGVAKQKISLHTHQKSEGKVFTELFIWSNNHWKQVAETDTTGQISYTFKNDTKCLLRIQPELLTETKYSINMKSKGVAMENIPESDKIAFY